MVLADWGTDPCASSQSFLAGARTPRALAPAGRAFASLQSLHHLRRTKQRGVCKALYRALLPETVRYTQ
eukprot:COSAG02_NODE_45564_length_356_cov_0.599222_1_plen_68_part_10